jgi:hypothetical protein
MDYFKVMPRTHLRSVCETMLPLHVCKRIFQRQDVTWSAGGFLPMKIIENEQFWFSFADSKPQMHSEFFRAIRMGSNDFLARRECRSVVFRGTIKVAIKLNNDTTSCSSDTGKLPLHFREQEFLIGSREDLNLSLYDKDGWSTIKGYRHCECSRCQLVQWYSHRRVVLKYEENVSELCAQFSYTCELINEVTKPLRDICGPLLLPTKLAPQPEDEKAMNERIFPPLGRKYIIQLKHLNLKP